MKVGICLKKLLGSLIIVSTLFLLAACGGEKKSLIELKSKDIIVSENGTFSIEGSVAEKGTLVTLNGSPLVIQPDDDGNFKNDVQMNDPIDSAELVAKYNSDSKTINIKFDTSKYKDALTKASEESKTQESIQESEQQKENADEEKNKAENEDITKLTENPTSEQTLLLQNLANQKFKQDYQYKGSKLHSLTGRIQDWTADGDHWFAKIKATIVNDSGAERDATVEIFITPTDATSGEVTLDVY